MLNKCVTIQCVTRCVTVFVIVCFSVCVTVFVIVCYSVCVTVCVLQHVYCVSLTPLL